MRLPQGVHESIVRRCQGGATLSIACIGSYHLGHWCQLARHFLGLAAEKVAVARAGVMF